MQREIEIAIPLQTQTTKMCDGMKTSGITRVIAGTKAPSWLRSTPPCGIGEYLPTVAGFPVSIRKQGRSVCDGFNGRNLR